MPGAPCQGLSFLHTLVLRIPNIAPGIYDTHRGQKRALRAIIAQAPGTYKGIRTIEPESHIRAISAPGNLIKIAL